MEDYQVAVDTIVDLQVFHGLNTQVVEVIVVEGVHRQAFFLDLALIFYFFVIDVLHVVTDESVAISPEALFRNADQAVHKFLLLARRRDYLKREEGTDVPDNDLVDLIHGEDEGSLLNNTEVNNRFSLSFQLAKQSITEQILWTPHICKRLEAERNQMAAEVCGVDKLLYAGYVPVV